MSGVLTLQTNDKSENPLCKNMLAFKPYMEKDEFKILLNQIRKCMLTVEEEEKKSRNRCLNKYNNFLTRMHIILSPAFYEETLQIVKNILLKQHIPNTERYLSNKNINQKQSDKQLVEFKNVYRFLFSLKPDKL